MIPVHQNLLAFTQPSWHILYATVLIIIHKNAGATSDPTDLTATSRERGAAKRAVRGASAGGRVKPEEERGWREESVATS